MNFLLHVLNYVGYFTGLSVGATIFSNVWWKLWKFVSDEDYANNHPRMYLFKFFAVLALEMIVAMAIIWYPLTKIMQWIDAKIDSNEDEENEWD